MDTDDSRIILQTGQVIYQLGIGHGHNILAVRTGIVRHADSTLGGKLQLILRAVLTADQLTVGHLDKGDMRIPDPIVLLGRRELCRRLPENADFNVIPLGGEDIECRILRRNRLRLGSLFRGAGFRPRLGGRLSFRVLVRTSRFSRFLYVLCPRGRGFLTAVSGASGHSAATQQQQSHRGNQAKQTFG